ncbi:hypothetical protein Barb6_03139 [Bacteroidales bacterium Barb6]|nr:hypothetical protein Barb6_03139 [Bacteroidales bacterium Barb6]
MLLRSPVSSVAPACPSTSRSRSGARMSINSDSIRSLPVPAAPVAVNEPRASTGINRPRVERVPVPDASSAIRPASFTARTSSE